MCPRLAVDLRLPDALAAVKLASVQRGGSRSLDLFDELAEQN